ncbi:hypothetical protein [Kitasatospora sp. NPDC093102]|uniref:hypothetical protein n=1 Tax=Kitasatospora sp. NPDC093102 TaxID=3155069 RepID=UPI00341FFB8A
MTTPRLPAPAPSSKVENIAEQLLLRWQAEPGAFVHEGAPGLTSGEYTSENGATVIRHVLWGSRRFRYLTLEKVHLGEGLDALQAVMAPDPSHPAPIFGLQVVARGDRVVWAFADLSPVLPDGSLGPDYERALAGLPADTFQHTRELPSWGGIFSRHALGVHPRDEDEYAGFERRVTDLLDLLLAVPTPTDATPEQLRQAWERYRHTILEGEQRRRILERDFAADWLEQYATTSFLPPLPEA